MDLTVAKLRKAKPENLVRLAKFLKLNTKGMSHAHLARLVRWRITREDMKKSSCLFRGW